MNPILPGGMRPVSQSSISFVDSETVCINFGDTEKLDVRYCLPIAEGYDPNGLRVFLLNKSNLPEQSILEIKLDDCENKAGHLFPMQLYETEDISYTQKSIDDPRILRFQKVAFAALCHIARVYRLDPKWEAHTEPVSLVDHFGDDTVVLIVSNDKSRAPENFDLGDYLPNLFKYGYLKYSTPADKDGRHELNVPFEDISQLTLLTLKKVSPELPNIDFVKNIFIELLPGAWSPITSFFLCYQVIEACIEKVRLEHCDQFIANLEASKNDAVMMRKAMGDYHRDSSERERIKRLFLKFLSTSTANSFIEGKSLLKRIGMDDSELVEDYAILYDLRNYFFHAFPVVRGHCTEDQLKAISWEFLLLTLEVLFRFKVQ